MKLKLKNNDNHGEVLACQISKGENIIKSYADTKDSKESERCSKCNKRLNLMIFKCKCEKNFCPKHRYAEEHNCNFDYKLDEKNRLERINPKVTSNKLNRI